MKADISAHLAQQGPSIVSCIYCDEGQTEHEFILKWKTASNKVLKSQLPLKYTQIKTNSVGVTLSRLFYLCALFSLVFLYEEPCDLFGVTYTNTTQSNIRIVEWMGLFLIFAFLFFFFFLAQTQSLPIGLLVYLFFLFLFWFVASTKKPS